MSEIQSAIQVKSTRNFDLRLETGVTYGSLKFASTADPNKTDFSEIILDDFESEWPKENSILLNTHPFDFGVETVTESDPKVPFDLDPSFETSVDIQELLKGAEVNEEDFEHLASVLTSREGTTLLDLVQQANTGSGSAIDTVTSNNFTNIVSSNNSLANIDFMNNEEATSINSRNGEWSVLTVNANDLLDSSQDSISSRDSTFSDQQIGTVSSSVPSPTLINRPPRGKPGRKPSGNGPIRPRKRQPVKDTVEYFEKRERNNVAVRKSRDKAKQKQEETQQRVQQLVDENENLNKKLDLLTKELNVLKSLFINVGSSLPKELEKMLAKCS
jgi:hypothetical protein